MFRVQKQEQDKITRTRSGVSLHNLNPIILNINHLKINAYLNRYLIKPIEDIFYPPVCFFCNLYLPAKRKIICSSCWKKLPRFGPVKTSKNNLSTRIYLLYKFNDTVRQLIHLFKYRRFLTLAQYFAEEIIKTYPYLSENNYSYIIAVPLHKTRLRERGFNQSQLLASYIGKYINVSVPDNILVRNRYTISQTMLDKNERCGNVANAFECNIDLKGKKILLIDDIITTGNTIKECLKVLKKSNMECADILAIAGMEKTVFYKNN